MSYYLLKGGPGSGLPKGAGLGRKRGPYNKTKDKEQEPSKPKRKYTKKEKVVGDNSISEASNNTGKVDLSRQIKESRMASYDTSLPYSEPMRVDNLSFWNSGYGQSLLKNSTKDLEKMVNSSSSTGYRGLVKELKVRAGYHKNGEIVDSLSLIENVKQDEQIFMRGIQQPYWDTDGSAVQYAEDLKTGEYFHGASGVYGSGIYVGAMDRALSYAKNGFETVYDEKNKPIKKQLSDNDIDYSSQIITMKIKKGDLREISSIRAERKKFLQDTLTEIKKAPRSIEARLLKKQFLVAAEGLDAYCTFKGIKGMYDRKGIMGEPPHAIIYDRRALTFAKNTIDIFENTDHSQLYELTTSDFDNWND